MNKLEGTRSYIEDLLRECEYDNLYFGKNKGSIYWVPGAEAWCYLCGDKTEWGQADDLLDDVDDEIILSYYQENREEIDSYVSNS